jgi:hypothetical protein
VRPESLSVIDDFLEQLFLLGLEGKALDLVLPGHQVLELRASSVTGDLDSPIADGASVLIVLLDLSTGDLQALPVIPFVAQFALDHHASFGPATYAKDLSEARVFPTVDLA